MKKILNNHGETLIETLLALMIIILAFTVLPFAMQTASKIESSASDNTNNFSYSRRDTVPLQISISYDGTDYIIPDEYITAYKDNGYVFYEYSSQDAVQ